MRRETDFVLEKAPWPTMLLEAGGAICRANQAARRLFGFADGKPAFTAIASIWDEKNSSPPDKFLREQSEADNSRVKLRLPQGATADFIAHVAKVARDEQEYFLLQLFKESGAQFEGLGDAPAPKAATTRTDRSQVFSALLDADWPALVMDKQGMIIQANSTAERVFGATAVVKGAGLMGLGPPEEAAALAGFLKEPSQHPAAPVKLCQAKGSVMPFEIASCAAGDGKWIILQFFKARESSAPARKPDDNFLLENSEWPALLVRKHGRIVRANRAAVRAFGPGIEQEESQLGAIWSPQNRDTWQQFLNLPSPAEPAPLKFQLKSGLPEDYLGQISPSGEDDVFVLQLLKPPAGGAAKVEAANVPIVDATPGGTPEGNLAHKQKLDCALQLARSVALDFNNALTSILGHTSLLLSKAEMTHPWRSSLGEIEKSAAKAAEIANDLAAFSRQEKDSKVHAAGNLNLVLERTVDVFQGSTQSSIAFSRQLERKLFTANFDEAKLQQAFVKIFENAVESIKGPGKINVQTHNLELTEATQDRTARLNPGNYVCVEISDTGAGITDDVMPHVFEPFFSTKGSTHRGLGLAWVYGIVTNHGGGVALSSQLGIGTTVRLYLPANRKIVRDAPVAEGDLNGTETVLFVDDEDLLLTMARTVLTAYGYTVLTANSGQKALELFTRSKKKIDLVVTDLVMPNMSGRELSEHLQKAAPGTRILWCSGYIRSSDGGEQERYLQKPFSAQDLLRKVKQVLVQ